ncbi:MAG: gamma-glutamylcyclotransferase family protein [Alphaproteobacteria bacterium]
MAIDLFFYGTLLDADIRHRVLGRAIPDDRLIPASVADYRRLAVPGRPYPGAVPDRGATLSGAVLRGVGVRDRARLTRYEGSEYLFRSVMAEFGDGSICQVGLFVFRRRRGLGGEWDLETWQRVHKPAYLEALAPGMTAGAIARPNRIRA